VFITRVFDWYFLHIREGRTRKALYSKGFCSGIVSANENGMFMHIYIRDCGHTVRSARAKAIALSKPCIYCEIARVEAEEAQAISPCPFDGARAAKVVRSDSGIAYVCTECGAEQPTLEAWNTRKV
jgi:hypothetical protein